MVLIVGLFWMWEVFRPPRTCIPFRGFQLGDTESYPLPSSRSGSLGTDPNPDFSPLLLLTSSYGVAFCPTAPVVIGILTMIYPRVDTCLLAITSLVGFIIGLYNAISLVHDARP